METTGNIPSDHIQLTWTDSSNITRCHVVREVLFGPISQKGFSFGRFIFGYTYMGGSSLAGTTGKVTFRPDAEDPLPVPWLPGVKISFGKFYETDGTPFSFCPRTFLYQQEEKMKAANFKFLVGFELEFFLLNQDGTMLESQGYSEMRALRGKTWKILTEIVAGIDACGIPIWRYHAEGFPGQFEIVIGTFTGSLVKAADSLVLARQAIYHVAAEYDYIATFCPNPFKDFVSGGHIHISIENQHGENLFEVSTEKGNAILAGIFHNLPNMTLVMAPTGNSYDRLKPAHCCGAHHCIGTENRMAAIRLIKNENKTIQRFEIRPIDGTTNPYLTIGAIIGSGMEGLKQNSSLPLEINDDQLNLPETEKPPCLPASLSEAIQLFASSKFNEDLYGKELHQLLIKIKTKELEFWESPESMESKMERILRIY